MKRFFYILLGASVLWSNILQAQTPYDSFSPETWHPMLDMGVFECDEETQVTEPKEPVVYDTILCAAVIDRQEQVLLLVDIENLAVVASAPLTDDLYKWISVDPLVDKNIATSPYMYCNGNPIIYIDPDGCDWYQDEDGQIMWTDFHSQKEMRANHLNGRYLGEAVVVFDGYYDEQLGEGEKLIDKDGKMPANAKMANVTLYGPNSKDNIVYYLGYTMSSDPDRFGVLANGEYDVYRDSKLGPYGSPWAIERRGKLSTLYDINPAHPERIPAYISGVFIHRYNNNGSAGVYWDENKNRWAGRSEGCLLIEPGKWSDFMRQLHKTNSFHLILKRQ